MIPLTMNTIEVLRAAREVISDPKRWTQGHFARTVEGLLASADSPVAASWCAIGAVRKVCLEIDDRFHAYEALEAVIPENVADWNDDPVRTHAEVLTAFDRAISRAELQAGC